MYVATRHPFDAQTKGLLLGVAGVVVFALTLPMTRLAVGPADDPQLPPLFVTAGRAAFAAVPSALYLLWVRAAWPTRAQWAPFVVSALGTVVGFPLFLGLALRHVASMHAAVVTGVLPLATAVAAAAHGRQRASAGFWIAAAAGCALVLAFAASQGGGQLGAADGLLLLAVASVSVAYVAGALLARQMDAERVICWVLVGSLPLTLPVTMATWPTHAVRLSAWASLAYVSLFSMWIGFFAWYRALAIGGTLRVSQVQLFQPFLSLLFAMPLLGEMPKPATLPFLLAVLATVWVGKRMSAGVPAPLSQVRR